MPMNPVEATTVAAWLRDGAEIAFLDVREHGQYGASHPLRVVWLPYSMLEARIVHFVPRRATRTVLLDDGDGVAARAAARLEAMGYSGVHVMAGGNAAWGAAGLEVYKGVNVPSKAFGEAVEHAFDTPRIEPEELAAMRARGDDIVIVDGRTPAEFTRMSIPGGISVPNGELVYRINDIAPDPGTTVVVNCAGRTRSIIGAQTLRNAGIANRVVALKGGTMAWRLAGFELEHGKAASMPAPSSAGRAQAMATAQAMRERYALPLLDAEALHALRADPARTTYLLDVRDEAEFTAGHLPGARHAPGGQLVQATDEWCAVWGARIVLADEGSGVRATTAAHWLKQMGWEVYVLAGASALATERGKSRPTAPADAALPALAPAAARALVAAGKARFVDVDESVHYRARRLPGALWGCRPRIDAVAAQLPPGITAILYSEHETRARLAAIDLAESGAHPVAILAGGREAWCAGGGATEAAPGEPPDAERIDFLFWVHDRHLGNDQAARDYLAWEEELPAQLARSGERFALAT
jgi:rhodanese-related sulfurtransferase